MTAPRKATRILFPGGFHGPTRATMLSARAAYIAIIFISTLSNLHPDWHDWRVGMRVHRALDPHLAWSDAIDGLRNILLFVGFGAVWEVTSSRTTLKGALWRATLYGFLLSTLVETLQLFSPRRYASIADVTTNTGGAFLGALTIGLLVAATRARRDKRSYLGVPAFLLALGQFGAVLSEGVTPLFRQHMVTSAGGPIARLRRTLAEALPMSLATIPRTDFIIGIPAGCLGVLAFAEMGMGRWPAAGTVSLIGVGVSFLGEVAHGATGEIIVWGAAVARSVGIAVGAGLAAWLLPALTQRFRGAERIRRFLAAYVLMLIVWIWRPFGPRASFGEMANELALSHWIPMAALAVRGDVFSVGKVVQLFALLMPLGALLAAWPARKHGWLTWVWPAVWLSAILCLGHVVIDQRFFDVTNFLIMAAGAWMGWWIVRRAGVPERGTWLDKS